MSGRPADVRPAGPRRWPRRAAVSLRVFGWVVVVLAALWLRPVSLGGRTSFVLVSGDSMLPAAHSGDLVVVRSKARYDIGDVVVFDIDRGAASGRAPRVMHRILSIDGDGRVTTQGDNRATADHFDTTRDDIVGEAGITIRGVGPLLRKLSSPWALALAGGVFIAVRRMSSDGPEPQEAPFGSVDGNDQPTETGDETPSAPLWAPSVAPASAG